MEGNSGPSLGIAVSNRGTCAVCLGFVEEGHPRGRIIRRRDRYYYIYIHYPNLVILDRSAQNGCHVCLYLRHELKSTHLWKYHWPNANELERTREEAFNIEQDTAEAVRLVNGLEADGCDNTFPTPVIVLSLALGGRIMNVPQDYEGLLHFQLEIGRVLMGEFSHRDLLRGVLADPIDPDPPARDLLSENHTKLVHRWKKTCDDKHEKCRLGLGKSRSLPKRLLEISSDPDTGEIKNVRLIETTPNSEGTYACLSYCWGQSAQEYKTTKSNFGQYSESIPFKSLPGTITDTLKLCCKLGFRHVWIDSLCIIQQDDDDWEREVSNMARIYGRSNLTLAIHLCKDSSESFLQKRQQPEYQFWGESSARLAYKEKHTGKDRLIYMWNRKKDKVRFIDYDWGLYGIDWRRSPWLDRAWVLQEWLLSPRVLHIHQFTQWDCFESYGNEIEHRFLVETPKSRTLGIPGYDRTWTWMKIVDEFTRRNITNDEDRLPALAGLAEKYRKATGYEYLAGMWQQELPKALLWFAMKPGGLKSPSGFRAPSWSWASLIGEVGYPYITPGFEETIERRKTSLISAKCTYSPPDTLSKVTDAWLDMQGPISLVVERVYEFPVVYFISDVSPVRRWQVHLDQDSCLTEDITRCKIYILEISEHDGLVLEKTEQCGGKDTFKRRGIASGELYNRSQYGYGERKVIRLV